MKPQRAALYTRISTREGKQFAANQLTKLREYAERMGWTVAAEYSDQESGAMLRRPALDQAITAAARREFDVFLVFDLSRLTRGGPSTAFEYIARMNRSGVTFCSMTEEHFRTNGPAGDLFIAIAAHIAQMERTGLRARILAGLERARREGRLGGRPRKIVDLDKLYTLRSQGKTLAEIRTALKNKISRSQIHKILKAHQGAITNSYDQPTGPKRYSRPSRRPGAKGANG